MSADPSAAPDRNGDLVPDDRLNLAALTYLGGTKGGDSLGGSGSGTFVDGQGGPDQLYGTPFRDYIAGKDGSDLLYGHGGSDELEGGGGGDIFALQPDGGTDLILDFRIGQGDRLFVEGGREQVETVEIDADTTQFRFDGSNAVTVLGLKPDVVKSRPDDIFTDTSGVVGDVFDRDGDGVPDARIALDALTYLGGTGEADTIRAGTGPAFLDGLAGNDVLSGGPKRDYLAGKEGNDILVGRGGSDEYQGGPGADIFVLGPGGGLDLFVDFNAGVGDRIALMGEITVEAVTALGEFDTQLRMSDGGVVTLRGVVADKLAASLDNVIVPVPEGIPEPGSGGSPADGSEPPPAPDRIDLGSITYTGGTAGADALNAGDGGAFLDAFGGDDTLSGGAGRDYLAGKGGRDTLNGSAGDDEYLGGSGGDRFVFDTVEGHNLILDFKPDEGDEMVLPDADGVSVVSTQTEGTGARFVFDGGSVTVLGLAATGALDADGISLA